MVDSQTHLKYKEPSQDPRLPHYLAFPKAQKSTLSSFPHSTLLGNRGYISAVSEQCRIRLIRISLIQKIMGETGDA